MFFRSIDRYSRDQYISGKFVFQLNHLNCRSHSFDARIKILTEMYCSH